jgi:hypothetical protein
VNIKNVKDGVLEHELIKFKHDMTEFSYMDKIDGTNTLLINPYKDKVG